MVCRTSGKAPNISTPRPAFAGNGLTFGTLAGIMIADAILERSNPWAELFDPGRKALTRGLWDYLKENIDYPYYMTRDRFAGADGQSLRAVKRGQGRSSNGTARRSPPTATRLDGHAALRHLHAYGVRRGLEHGRAHLGLSVSRIAVQAGRRRDLRAGRSAPLRGGVTRRVRDDGAGRPHFRRRQRRGRRVPADLACAQSPARHR